MAIPFSAAPAPTPRTDAEEVYYSEIVTGRDAGLYWVRSDFARQLERENADLRHDLERAMANHNADINAAPQPSTATDSTGPSREGLGQGEAAAAAPQSGLSGPARLELPSQLWLAQWFHDTYERLAPEYGYVTRNETRVFDPFSPNGKLMIAVCKQLREALDVSHATTREPSQ